MKVLHIITCLDAGGANMMLYKLVSGMDRMAFENEVISLVDIGPVGQKIQASGVPVRAVGMRRGIPNPIAVLRLARSIRQNPPDIIQTWGYHDNLIGGLAAKLAGNIPVVWNIQHGTLDPQTIKKMTLWTAKTCARLSRWLPEKIVCCSEVSRQTHAELGYEADKMVLIPNAADLKTFKPDLSARESVRQELGIPSKAPLIGLVNRFHPMKDHHNFVQAVAILLDNVPESHFLLCGDGVTWENPELAGWIEAAGIREQCHLLGERKDIPRITAALDVAALASCGGEGFPNVIGEAMACGVPCVVTDVGDSAMIVGKTGIVVSPGDPQALASGWKQILIDMSLEERQQLRQAARHRISEICDLGKIVTQYESTYKSLVPTNEL